MPRRRLTIPVVTLALVVAVLVSACGGGDDDRDRSGTVERGGVFRTAIADFGFTNGLDPTGEYGTRGWTFYGAMLRTLVSYRRVAGPPGNQLYPDLATGVPAPADGGLTYSFKLKEHLRFGPPLNRPITSRDIAYAFQRINTAQLAAQYGFYYAGTVKGMDGKASSPSQKISGIETPDDQTISFHLERPTGDFLYRLAMSATAPIPEEVAKCFRKAGDYGRYVISSGPYMIQGSDKLDISSCDTMRPISGFDPSKRLALVRNPNYDQATDNLRANYVDGVTADIDSNVADIFDKVQTGALDASLGQEQPPKTLIGRYASDPSKRRYLHANPTDATVFLSMNAAVEPFDDVHVRKAVNWVLDRQAVVQAAGGTRAVQLATHVMPPTLLGNRLGADYHPYATDGNRGDQARAADEIRRSRYDRDKDGRCDAAACRNLIFVTQNQSPATDMEPVVVHSLAKLGIELKTRELAPSAAFSAFQTVANKVPLAYSGWGKDYADPYTFAAPLFEGSSIVPVGNTNHAMVGLTRGQASALKLAYPAGGVASVDADVERCQRIPGTQPDQRLDCWVALDKQLMERVVPWVPLAWEVSTIVAAPSLTRYEFDQAAGELSLTQIAVANRQAMP